MSLYARRSPWPYSVHHRRRRLHGGLAAARSARAGVGRDAGHLAGRAARLLVRRRQPAQRPRGAIPAIDAGHRAGDSGEVGRPALRAGQRGRPVGLAVDARAGDRHLHTRGRERDVRHHQVLRDHHRPVLRQWSERLQEDRGRGYLDAGAHLRRADHRRVRLHVEFRRRAAGVVRAAGQQRGRLHRRHDLVEHADVHRAGVHGHWQRVLVGGPDQPLEKAGHGRRPDERGELHRR